MSMRSDALAPSSTGSWTVYLPADRAPELLKREQAALDVLAGLFAQRRRRWPKAVRDDLERLLSPVEAALGRMSAAPAPRNSAIRVITQELIARRRAWWAWAQEEWLDVLCPTEGDFHTRNGCHGNCRQYVVALAYRLGGYDRLEDIGTFFQYRLALKVFGREAVDAAGLRVREETRSVGFTAAVPRGLMQALYAALLYQRSDRLEDVTVETLQRVASSGPEHVRTGAAALSRALARLGMIKAGFSSSGPAF